MINQLYNFGKLKNKSIYTIAMMNVICFKIHLIFIAIRFAIRTQIIECINRVKDVDVSQIIQLLVSAILGTASIYSMIQNALIYAVGFMILLYAFGIFINHRSNKIPTKEAEYVLKE